MTTRGHVAGSQRRTIENLREANAGLVKANQEWQDKCLAMQTGRDAALVHGPEDLIRALEEQRTLIETLERRVEAVLALHHPTSTDGRYCTYCGRVMPCPTRRALEGEK